jgi:hypothetical protein
VPIPPNGKAIIFRFGPLKVRGKAMRLRAAPCPSFAKEGSLGAVFGVEAGFSCPDIARAPPANAPPAATFFKNSRRSNFPFFFRVATIPSV